jgi:hypothetical protein
MSVLAHIEPMEDALTSAGFPAMSPWWRAEVTRFYATARRQLVLRVGRRGGKSSTLCRIAVLEALFGEHTIPPGDVGVAAFVSISRDEAGQRLRTIKAILDALHVRYRPIEHGVELEERQIAFKTYVATIAGVSGFTCICAVADEVSKWRDADSGANPATEVLASFRPTMATQPNARMFLSSSPLGPDDAHAVAFDEGETSFQCVAYAPTWEAHPAVTAEATHDLEPDDRKWRREYLAIPQASALAALDHDQVVRAVGKVLPDSYLPCAPIVLIDPTAGSSDAYTFAAARWYIAPDSARYVTKRTWSQAGKRYLDIIQNDERGERIPNPDWRKTPPQIMRFEYVYGFDQAVRRGFTSDDVVKFVAKIAREYNAVAVHSDQFERFALASAVNKHGLPFYPHSWTAPLKERAIERVRGWLRDDVLALPEHERMKSELLAFEERIAPSGALTFRGRQGGHDDYAMLVMLAALVDIEGQFPGSPLAPPASAPLPRWLVA